MSEVDINLFGVFDGHGGNRCSNFLKDNLFTELLNNKDFSRDLEQSIKDSFHHIDDTYLKSVDNSNFSMVDRSGSCAIVCMLIGRTSSLRRRRNVFHERWRLEGCVE